MLTDLLAKVERIFFVGLPTSRVQHEEWSSAYAARNAAMKVPSLPHPRTSLIPGRPPPPPLRAACTCGHTRTPTYARTNVHVRLPPFRQLQSHLWTLPHW